ncbi:MAG: preprotein translocase subunit SecG [Tissierellia bacterium]|nr:preprotein translocase subunit SecG [Tissierellia bacterium]
METVLIVLLVISSIVIILTTMLMDPKTEGMGALSGSETNVFGKSASKGKEKLLSRLTIIFAVVFMITSVLIAVLSAKAL